MLKIKSLCVFLLVWGSFLGGKEIVYLTWTEDPSTTMMVMWHTQKGEGPIEMSLQKQGDEGWRKVIGSHEVLGVNSDVEVHKAHLAELEPDTDYLFRVGQGEVRRFKTLPQNLDRPLEVAVSGDALFSRELFEKMNALIAKSAPDFAVVGGDIAYTEGLKTAIKSENWRIARWQEYFEIWTRQMVTPDGRTIPMVPVIGNHDVLERFSDPFKGPVLFYQLFAFPRYGIPYRSMQIGKDVAFILLDSGHTYPIGGGQAEWLEETLMDLEEVPYKVPVYHIAAYPSVYSLDTASSEQIRKFWVPLFEQYGVRISMENDNHAFKRTYPMLRGKIHDDGITYLGDGDWGVPPRQPKRRPYLAKAAKIDCYWKLVFSNEECRSIAYNIDGEEVDHLVFTSGEKAAARVVRSSVE